MSKLRLIGTSALFALGLFCACRSGPDGGESQSQSPTEARASEQTSISPQSPKRDDRRQVVETQFVLENKSSKPVVVRLGDCMDGGVYWLSVAQDGASLETVVTCAECPCRRANADGWCGQCGAPCWRGTQEKELAPTDSVTWSWSGRVYRERQKGSSTCLEQSPLATGTVLTAEFCWHDEGDERQRRCTTESFTYGQDRRVVGVVQ